MVSSPIDLEPSENSWPNTTLHAGGKTDLNHQLGPMQMVPER